jgi:Na+/melibiose symporter-like transporter
MILSTGINLISDVIGSKGDSGALVFGIYSFLDKISAGIVIFTIANLSSFTYGEVLTANDELIIKGTVIFIPIISVFVSAFITFIYNVSEYLTTSKGKLS